MNFEPRFSVTPHMQRCIVAIERTVGFLESLRLSDGEALARLREECRVQEALNSVQIEGNSMTLETAFALANEMPTTDVSEHDLEFINYLRAFDALETFRGQRNFVLTGRDLREIHRILVQGVRGGDRHAGQFRQEAVQVGDVQEGKTVIHHEPAEHFAVPALIGDLLDWLEATKIKGKRYAPDDPWIHPAIQAGILHHRLVWIHPFVDGNGRTSRMFTALLLYQRGYDFKFLFELSSYYNNNRDAYYASLRSADETGDYTQWLGYFLGGLAMQMYQVRDRAKSIVGDAVDDEQQPE